MKQRNIEPYPAWADAHLAHKYIYKGKARGSTVALFVRGVTQRRLGHVGKWAGRRGGILIFLGIASMAMLCIGINNVRLDTTLDSLWTPNSGRLLQELTYVSKVSGLTTDTNEMLIQTPKKDAHSSILHSKALLEHLQVLQKALAVTVDLYDITWSLTDLCYSANIPNFDVQMIDQIFEKIFPCVIITPLDCFWEGAKLLGPSFPIQIPNLANFRGPPLKWTNLNPQELLQRARLIGLAHSGGGVGFPFEILEGFMKRAGIGTGYQEKPCLDPMDPECPVRAPNKGSHMPPDVASILAQGCYGFAPRFMHWAPDLIIGGAVQNKSGHVVKAGGLMSTVQLMSSSELFEFFRETWRLHHVEWTESKAQAVLTAWQTRFAAEVSHLTMDEERSHQFNFYSFTPAGLDSVVEAASQFSWAWGGARVIGVIIAASFVGIVLSGDMANWRVRLGLVVGGALIALLGSAAGCGAAAGLSMITAITFNVASVQVMPYLTMSLVSQVFFILLHSQLNSGCDARSTLKRHGFSLLLGIIVAAVFIGAGAIFPIPAVRSIALQGSMLIIVSSLGLLIVFPALCQIVLKKRKVSTACSGGHVANNTGCAPGACPQSVPFLSSNNNRSSNRSSNKFGPAISVKNNNVNLNKSNNTNSVNYSNKNGNDGRDSVVFICDSKGKDSQTGDVEAGDCDEGHEEMSKNWIEYYNSIINWKWFKGVVGVVYLAWIIVSGLGMIRLRLGLPITDVVPSNSSEYQFLTAQGKLFPVYHMRAVTKANFDYPNNQKLLHRFHDTMSGLPWVIRDDNGGVPPMWLSVFRSWLVRLQAEFDKEWKEGKLHKEGWNDNASADGILAWKLAVQTGHVDHPVDITQLPGNRLVDGEGVVNARAFYVYLTAWAWNDPLAYGSTAANLKPEPRNWVHSPEDKDLKIPKSAPIKYAEISYLLRTVRDDQAEQDQESQILAFVREIRQICGTFEARGLPVFPWGIPFRFYEQYLDLPMKSGIVVGSAAAVTSVILFFSLGCSLRPVGVVFTIALVTLIQIAGTVGWLGVGLNALPVEIALLGVSLVVVSTIQMLVAFCCIPGPVSVRRAVAFSLVGPPCVQSLVLITLTALILYSPEFMFIFTHFTLLVALSALFSLANFLLLLPSLLSVLKPTCWLVGLSPEDPTLLQPLTPSPLPKRSGGSKTQRNSRSGSKSSRNSYPPPPYSFRGSSSRGGNYYHGGSSRNGANSRAPSENSLSTITEEPSSCATRRSAEIIVQPQVVVETFDGDNSSKTKVSAKLKVEVHSSMHSSNSNAHCSVASSNMSENSGTSASTSSSGSFTSSSASSSTSSYNEKATDD